MWPAVAGVVYVATWLVGLSIWPSNPPLDASAGRITAVIDGHTAQAVTQYLLVEGVAAVPLGVVLWSMLALVGLRSAGITRPVAMCSLLAVAVSLSQCGLGIALVAAAHHGHVERSGDLYELVNRLDGVKMLSLAIVAAFYALTTALPVWLRTIAAMLSLSLVASGFAYLFILPQLAWTVYLSGPLLLVWIAGTGIAIATSTPRTSTR